MKIKVGNVCRVIYSGSWAQGWPCVIDEVTESHLYCTIFNSDHIVRLIPGNREYFKFIGNNDLITYINEL